MQTRLNLKLNARQPFHGHHNAEPKIYHYFHGSAIQNRLHIRGTKSTKEGGKESIWFMEPFWGRKRRVKKKRGWEHLVIEYISWRCLDEEFDNSVELSYHNHNDISCYNRKSVVQVVIHSSAELWAKILIWVKCNCNGETFQNDNASISFSKGKMKLLYWLQKQLWRWITTLTSEDFFCKLLILLAGSIIGSEWSKLRKKYFPRNVGVNLKNLNKNWVAKCNFVVAALWWSSRKTSASTSLMLCLLKSVNKQRG